MHWLLNCFVWFKCFELLNVLLGLNVLVDVVF